MRPATTAATTVAPAGSNAEAGAIRVDRLVTQGGNDRIVIGRDYALHMLGSRDGAGHHMARPAPSSWTPYQDVVDAPVRQKRRRCP